MALIQGKNSIRTKDSLVEKRAAIRYRLGAPAMFSWESAHHKRMRGEGVTRDISFASAFIFTRTCPPVGATIELDVLLSPALDSARKTVRIKTEATVIRVEHTAEAEGFASVSQNFILLFDGDTRNAFGVSSARINSGL